MRIRIAVAALLMLILASAVEPAKADPYRWCAQDMGSSGSSNCYFLTLDQCRATAAGAGSFCTPNTLYTGPDADTPKQHRARSKPRG